jgi:hypothetical protein
MIVRLASRNRDKERIDDNLCDGTNSLCLQRVYGCYNDILSKISSVTVEYVIYYST